MTDRELLELAAKAAGYVIEEHVNNGSFWVWVYPVRSTPDAIVDMPIFKWNPLNDDSDALRLVVQLRLTVEVWDTTSFELAHSCCTRNDINTMRVRHDSDPYAATRRAIVRAAAEIGEVMK